MPLRLLAAATVVLSDAESPQDRWNLEDLNVTRADWDADATRVQAQLKDEGMACRGARR